MSQQFKASEIDRGEHKIPTSVRRQQELLEKINSSPVITEDVIEEARPQPEYEAYKKPTPTKDDLGLSKHVSEYIRNNLSTTESLISWYYGISNSKSKDHIFLGIPNFPIQVKVNALNAKINGNSLTVFVKSDNALEISLPIASEVVLHGKIGDVDLEQRKGLFLGEVAFDKNFLFKILIFVLQ